MFKLSSRMQLIYDHLLPGKPVWDFCCDHGYIGLNAYKSGLFPSVHFVDQVRHIIEQLEQSFAQEHRDEDLEVDAYFVPEAGENINMPIEGTVIIAGVGSFTIEHILRNLTVRGVLRAQRLILCPQDKPDKLIHGLCQISDFNYELCNEDCKTEERGRIRKLLILNRKNEIIVS